MGLAEIIIVIVIVFQTWSFLRNLWLMRKYATIFPKKYDILRKPETGPIIIEITGESNDTFRRIKDSINGYLTANSDKIIDYGLLKDAVNRNCDSLEDEISTQMPVPLYLGLCGTMGGVILGLWDLISSGSIVGLLSGSGSGAATAYGVNSLLSGVALAMCASVCGIFYTIINTWIFKKSKKEEEKRKNKFLSWMQATLLPVLPSSMSNAMTKMVRNLNKFNRTFSEKVDEMADTLSQVNEVYSSEEEIISEVRQLLSEERQLFSELRQIKLSSTNVQILNAIKRCLSRFEVCSDNIEKFSNCIEKIDESTEKLNGEIEEFYKKQKGEIVKATADSQDTLDEALNSLREASEKSVKNIQRHLVDQMDKLTETITKNNEEFVKKSNEMQAEFAKQLEQTPEIEKKLEEISNIPAAMNALGQKIDNLTKAVEKNKGYVSKSSHDTRLNYGSNPFNSTTTNTENREDKNEGLSTHQEQAVDNKSVRHIPDNKETEEEKEQKTVLGRIREGFKGFKSMFSKKDKNSEI